MTRDEKTRTHAAMEAFTRNGEHSSGFLRNDIRDLMVCLMSLAADHEMDVPKLTNASLKIYGEVYGHNV